MEGGKLSTVLLLLALACCVAGVRADSTLTALIISSCASGLLILLVILGSIIYCVIRYQRKQDYLQKTSGGPVLNGHYRPMGMGDPSSLSPGGRRTKAHTQHAPFPRHRPPLTFYTVRADPRDVGLTPPLPPPGRAFPLGAGFVTAPPNFGRPVLYLDMLDAVAGPKANGVGNGFLRCYIPKHATTAEYYYANGHADGYPTRAGESSDEQETSEERYRRKDKKSRGRSKSRSRGGESPPPRPHLDRSRSRSLDARSAKQKPSSKPPQPMEEAPVLAIPGDIILAESNMARDAQPLSQEAMLTRSFSQPRVEDPGRGFVTTTLQERRYTMTFDNEVEQEYDDLQRSDIYYLPSNRTEDPFEAPSAESHHAGPDPRPASSSHFIPVSNFPRLQSDSESEAEPQPTPRADYMEAAEPSPAVASPDLKRQSSESDPEPTPAPDYSARAVVSTDTQAFSFSEVRQTYPTQASSAVDGRDGHRAFEAMLNSVNLNSEAARRQRPPTPPFDGETSPRESLTFSPSRPPTLGQLDSTRDARIPTPPPDIPSPVDDYDDDHDHDDDVDAGRRFSGILAGRPPTPPPGKLLRPKGEDLGILHDLQEEGARAKQLRASSQTSLPTLPFMAELKRRQRDPDGSDDEDPSPPPQFLPPPPAAFQQDRGDYPSRNLDAVLSLDQPNGARVSFTPEPPEIIPLLDPGSPDGSSLQSPHSQQQPSSKFLPPPPPPPPPSPPPPPPPPPVPPPPPPMSSNF